MISYSIHKVFNTTSLIPAIFVLAVFLVSLVTQGYIYGITSALISVLAVNFAFNFPYFKFNFTMPENLVSAIIMIIVTLITGTLTTIIKRQEALKAEGEMERMRANLLRAVSHDLRTPLTTIYGSSSTILDNYDSLTEIQIKKMLQGIKEDSEWLSRMVENLLSITRLDAGNVKIIKVPTVLEELVDSVLRKFTKQYPDVSVHLDMPDELIIVPMDVLLIEQVMFNILNNAVIHATGMKNIYIKIISTEKKAIFEISDDGCGIPHELQKNIFSAFQYSGVTPLDTKSNSGIGLSVCSTIIKAHGGNINVQNRKEGGAAFSFSLDVEECEDE